jgi:hypothetical protein
MHGGAIVSRCLDCGNNLGGVPEDPALRRYRRVVTTFVAVAALIAVGLGDRNLNRGRGFTAFLSVCALGNFVLLHHG